MNTSRLRAPLISLLLTMAVLAGLLSADLRYPTPGLEVLYAAPPEVGGIAPYASAPECASHNPSQYHRLWDYNRGCHYDHEHGDNPFKPEVAAVLPFDIADYLGGTQIGTQYPTSPAEPTIKHGGFKWFVVTANPNGCSAGFEGAANCVQAAAVQVHAFGNLAVELAGREHSAVVFEKICKPATGECGYVFVVAHVDYGQRVTPYQGTVLPYPDNPSPSYGAGFGPYWSLDCLGPWAGCRPYTLAGWRAGNYNASSTVSNKPTGFGIRPAEPILVRLLLRTRDNYQVYDSASGDFRYLCGDGDYAPAACRYNNSTMRLHELGGEIPAAWDGDAYDTDPRVGFVSRTGAAGGLPYQVINAPVGKFGSTMVAGKPSNPTPLTNPERDYHFCGGVPCAETAPGAVPSGWLGPNN